MSQKTKLIWNDSSLTVINSFPELEKFLTARYKYFFYNKKLWKKEIKFKTVELYVKDARTPSTIYTYQGMFDKVTKFLIQHNIGFDYEDRRLAFPEPLLGEIGGFRHSQEQMFRDYVAQDRSGIFKACTRYGKSVIMYNLCKAFPVRTVITMPGVDLMRQFHADLKTNLPRRHIKAYYTGAGAQKKIPDSDIILCSLDSLHKCNFEATKMLIADEPHAAVTKKRVVQINRFQNARRFALGASTDGRFDGTDDLITGVFGPVLVERTFKEAVDEKAVLMIKAYIIRVPFKPWPVKDYDTACKNLIFQNNDLASIISELSDRTIPQDWQSLIFIKNEAQARLLHAKIPDAELGMDKLLSGKARKELFARMQDDTIKRCICSNIYSTGVTFPDLRVAINAEGGGGSISSTQKPGRLAQIRPGKTRGYVIDFLLEPEGPNANQSKYPKANNKWWDVNRDCLNRVASYRDKEYEVEIVNSINEIRLK